MLRTLIISADNFEDTEPLVPYNIKISIRSAYLFEGDNKKYLNWDSQIRY